LTSCNLEKIEEIYEIYEPTMLFFILQIWCDVQEAQKQAVCFYILFSSGSDDDEFAKTAASVAVQGRFRGRFAYNLARFEHDPRKRTALEPVSAGYQGHCLQRTRGCGGDSVRFWEAFLCFFLAFWLNFG
jgi:hypothetical protein